MTDGEGLLEPVDPSLCFSRGSPDDPRLGDAVLRASLPDDGVDVVLVGCPVDEGVRRNRGRPGAAEAPAAIRRAFYRFPLPAALEGRRLVDAGDLVVEGRLEEVHRSFERTVGRLLRRARLVVALGGGNDLSEPDVRALAGVSERPLVVNVDRHLDLRPELPVTSGTPYRRLLEAGVVPPERLHEVAVQRRWNAEAHWSFARQRGVRLHPLEEVRAVGPERLAASILAAHADADALFLGLDLDAVRAADAPGVSRPGPLGLTAEETVALVAAFARDPRLRLLEVTELNPRLDVDDRTACLAAEAIVAGLEGVGVLGRDGARPSPGINGAANGKEMP